MVNAPASGGKNQGIARNGVKKIVGTQNLAFSHGTQNLAFLQNGYQNKFGPQTKNLSSIIRGFKIGVKKYATMHNLNFAWQSRYYDRVLRNEKELNGAREYIDYNPDKWQWDKDNQAGIYILNLKNMKNKILAGGVVVGLDNKIVVVNQNGNSWSLPKGSLETGEDELAGAKREIYEETGIQPEKLKLIKKLGSYKRYSLGKNGQEEDKSVMGVRHFYLFITKQTELCPLDPENPVALWVNKDDVANLLTHPKDKEFFESIKDLI